MYCTPSESLILSKIFSSVHYLRRQFGQLVNISLACCQQRRDHAPSIVGEIITMRPAYLSQKAMGSQQSDLEGNFRGAASFFLWLGFARIEQAPKVSVAKPCNGELASINRFQQCPVFRRPGIERPKALPIYCDAATDRGNLLGQWCFARHTSKRLQVSRIGGSTDLRSSVEVSHSIAQTLPFEPFFRIPFPGAIYPELPWVDHRGFNSQDAALFIVHLNRIAISGVTQSNALGPVFERAIDLTPETIGAGPTKESEHMWTGETANAMMEELGIERRQRRGIFKQQIGRIFGLSCAPVVALINRPSDFSSQGMSLVQQRIEQLCPVALKLLVQKGLGGLRIADLYKAVVPLLVTNASPVHLASQPLTSIKTYRNGKRKPGLHAHMGQPKVTVLVIVIEMGAFAPFQNQMNLFGLPVSAHRVRPARFDSSEQGNQSLLDLVLSSQTSGQVLLGNTWVLKILYRTPGTFGGLVGRGLNPISPLLREGLEVFEQHLANKQVILHGLGIEEYANARLEEQPIKTRENGCNVLAEFGKKRLGSAVLGRKRVCFHQPNLYHTRRRYSTWFSQLKFHKRFSPAYSRTA